MRTGSLKQLEKLSLCSVLISMRSGTSAAGIGGGGDDDGGGGSLQGNT
jgi:hypothetical protein